MKIETNKTIKEAYLTNNLKAVDVISFLLENGFKSDKEAQRTALSELDYQGQKIDNVSLNSDFIIINFKK
ncbi:hypothetical protein AVT43_gp73 [Polaribacter phage P12002L]|uniref:Uncharacterized protein n=2 Tax=Incheonvirus TaxID=2976977 RepID=A0A0F7DD34_9CAUD|nr:hypothetical protein AVT42_gp75 [Polaribacter phage P12002S]YP_009209733.1 hypothetical protein AVT43_gp73 [Polaribacter phage P12002L]AKG94247.1 hypothetical protein P12002L_0073 [Polaribacter phage P12002L]AKG94331.1 hypothetical protein P12002S_0075 [Polaribacter phage P12002S]